VLPPLTPNMRQHPLPLQVAKGVGNFPLTPPSCLYNGILGKGRGEGRYSNYYSFPPPLTKNNNPKGTGIGRRSEGEGINK